MSKIEKVLLTGKTHTRFSHLEGAAGERVDLQLSSSSGQKQSFNAVVAHPTAEQLFAGAWSACYISAIGLVAAQKKVQLPPDLAVEIEVDLGQTGAAYFLQARLNVRAPGLPREVAEALAHGAHEICPYSKATRSNIEVALNVI